MSRKLRYERSPVYFVAWSVPKVTDPIFSSLMALCKASKTTKCFKLRRFCSFFRNVFIFSFSFFSRLEARQDFLFQKLLSLAISFAKTPNNEPK